MRLEFEHYFSFLILCVLSALIASAITPFFGGYEPNYSNGFRVGRITKLSERGLLCKETHGELAVEGVDKDSPTLAVKAWAFNVTDPRVREALIDSVTVQRKVRLVYRQWVLPPWCFSTNYEVVKVETFN
jgi:hypothetical protein